MRALHATSLAATLLAFSVTAAAQRGAGGPAADARASAPIDLTGYWVAVVTEDWRWRMVTPPRGDYTRVPLTPEARQVADAWDPAADAAAGLACKAYGAGAIMRVPGRLRIAWEDADTLRIDTDAGMQTRLLHFEAAAAAPGERTWQGHSTARWERPGRGRGAGPGDPQAGGALAVTTTGLRAGYLRKNGVPYSEDAVVREYFDVAPLPGGGRVLLVTTIVEDPRFLQQPFIVSSQFKQEADGSQWDPTPCSAT